MTIIYIGKKWLCVDFGKTKIYRNKRAERMVDILVNDPLSVRWSKWVTVRSFD